MDIAQGLYKRTTEPLSIYLMQQVERRTELTVAFK